MNIRDQWQSGNREKLAIISDFASIFGLSAVAIFSALVGFSKHIQVGNFISASVTTIFGVCAVLAGYLLVHWFKERTSSGVVVAIIWLLFLAMILMVVHSGYEFWLNSRAFST